MPYMIIAAVIAALCAAFQAGVHWQRGVDAVEYKEAQERIRVLVEQGDKKGIEHAEKLGQLNQQLRTTQKSLYALTTGRKCLSAGAVRLLNSPGDGVPAAAGEPSSAAEAAAADRDDGEVFASDRDAGEALALCRTEYEKLSDQLNRILDITDSRRSQGEVQPDVRAAPR